MGLFSHLVKVVKKAITHPLSTIKKVVHNPAKAILNVGIRKSKVYKNIGRPIIKVGAAAIVGGLTGGVGLAAGGLTFAGVSAAGAVAGGLASAANGGLTNRAFSPVKDVVIPAAAGLVAGNVARSGVLDKVMKVSSIKDAAKLSTVLKGGVGVVSAIQGAKAQKIQNALDQQALQAQADQAGALISVPAPVQAVNTASNTLPNVSAFDQKGALAGAAVGAVSAGAVGAVVGGIAGGLFASTMKNKK